MMEALNVVCIVFAFIAIFISPIISSFVKPYLGEKGKQLATKQDIEEITRRIEIIRSEFSNNNAIEEQKRKLKYEACLESLGVIDAHLAQVFAKENAVPQPVSTIRLREVHSKLILSCSNVVIVEKFSEIILWSHSDATGKPPTDLLNEFRNLIRLELNFGSKLDLDRDRAWMAKANGDNVEMVKPGVNT